MKLNQHTWTAAPGSDKDFAADWSDWLGEINDTLVSSTWTIPSPLFGHDNIIEPGAKVAVTFIHAPTSAVIGAKYRVLNTIVTQGGAAGIPRTETAEIDIIIQYE